MRTISLAFVLLLAARAHAAREKPTYARLMKWTAGQRIEWTKCSHQLWEITSTFMRQPTGEEADPPDSVLELGVLDKSRNEISKFDVTVAQAHRRGYSLEGLRFRLNDKGWESILAIKIEDGKLIDFILMPTCDLVLLQKPKVP